MKKLINILLLVAISGFSFSALAAAANEAAQEAAAASGGNLTDAQKSQAQDTLKNSDAGKIHITPPSASQAQANLQAKKNEIANSTATAGTRQPAR